MCASTATKSAPPLLDYGTAPPLKHRRWFRATMACVALAIAGAATWRYGAAIAAQAEVLWWQRACMAYAAPSDRLVYTDDPVEADQLSGGSYLQMYRGGPALFRDLPAYQALSARVGYRGGTGGTIVYMHQRTNPRGQRRMVLIYASGPPSQIKASVYVPATLTSPGKWALGGTAYLIEHFKPALRGHARVFAGQDDPSDLARFTIAYELKGEPHEIRGTLQADDTVLLEGE